MLGGVGGGGNMFNLDRTAGGEFGGRLEALGVYIFPLIGFLLD